MPGEITILLNQWRDGDETAYKELIPHVYPHLRDVAASYLWQRQGSNTLQATALVH